MVRALRLALVLSKYCFGRLAPIKNLRVLMLFRPSCICYLLPCNFNRPLNRTYLVGGAPLRIDRKHDPCLSPQFCNGRETIQLLADRWKNARIALSRRNRFRIYEIKIGSPDAGPYVDRSGIFNPKINRSLFQWILWTRRVCGIKSPLLRDEVHLANRLPI